MERRLSAILSADVVGYSRLVGRHEARTLDDLKRHRHELLDARLAEHGGRIVKLTGDGILAEFPSAVNALACAAEIQLAMRERNAGVPEDERIRFRIGVNIGDVVVEDGDLFGEGVNVAARLEKLASPDGIAISSFVRDQVGSRLDFAFEDGGEQMLKNIDRPIRVYHVVLGAAPQAPDARAGKSADRPSVAVLPFNNMSGDPEQEYFSDGITEDLITDLSKVSGLHVVARNTVFTFKGRHIDVQQVAERLGVRYVLEGSVRKAGNRVRVTGQLIDGRTGFHIWADRFDRDLTDIFAIQDEIARTIVDQLKVKLLPGERAAIGRAPTDSVEAYTYYLRGRQFAQAWSKNYLQIARRMFGKALELDGNFARAHAGIADCDSVLHAWHGAAVSVDDILERSDRALALDPSLAEAHASRGFALHVGGRPEEAFVAFEKALSLDPDLHETHLFYGRACFSTGRLEQAAALFRRAAEIRADDYRSPCLLAMIYKTLGLEAERLAAARQGIERAERVLGLHPENAAPAALGAVSLAHLGEVDRAREWADRALAIEPEDASTVYNIACTFSILGEFDRAFDLLEKIVENSTFEQALWIPHDSDLDGLRAHPRYPELVRKLELAKAAAVAPS